MEASFWHERWEQGDIGFHESEVNPLLIKYFGRLNMPKGGRVFLPLCGKTRDISWLLANDYQVVGVELSEFAVQQLFEDLGVEPEVSKGDGLDHYHAMNIDIFVGDIFNLTPKIVGSIDAIYDRAALVALPQATRTRYAAHLQAVTDNAPQLLICIEYDQNNMQGPPFSIVGEEVKKHYSDTYDQALVERICLQGGLKGLVPATEIVWLLQAS